MNRRIIVCIFSLAACLCGCSEQDVTVQNSPGRRTDDMSWGPIEMSITSEPAEVQYDRDIIVTIRIVSSKEIEVDPPALENRLNGFILSGEYGGEPNQIADKIVIEKHARLTPLISDEYRIAPLAVTYNDKRKQPAAYGWFATRPISYQTAGISEEAGGNINDTLSPVWIYPSGKEVVLYVFAIIAVIIFIWLIIRAIKALHKEAQLRKMSPKERALKELEILLAKHLPDKALYKEFYIELTMIVRRYIERSHDIHAPEQTTEEFLAAISHDSRFSKEVLTTLKAFLESADLVKFAAYLPEQESVNGAITTARDYIDTDSREVVADNV